MRKVKEGQARFPLLPYQTRLQAKTDPKIPSLWQASVVGVCSG